MLIYQPKPVVVPADSGIVREIGPPTPFTAQERQRIDTRTIFYDIFKGPYGRRLHAVGPRLFNFKQELLPMQVFADGAPMQFQLYEIERIVFLETEELPNSSGGATVVELKFKTFSTQVEVDWDIAGAESAKHGSVRLTMSTLQKENPFEWIRDWLHWHVRLHGVQRLILYDNGSRDRDALLARLPELEAEAEIIFIDWPFPYGVPPYEYAQQGSLNHTRLLFGERGGYCLNMDIDEYLVKPDGGCLLDYVSDRLGKSELGAIAFSQRLIPNIADQPRTDPPRCFEFSYRFKKTGYSLTGESWNEIGRMKYVYQFDKIGYNATHRTASEKNKEFSKRYGLAHRLKFIFAKVMREVFGRFIGDRLPKARIDACYAAQDELFFYHFLGLNTGWNSLPLIEEAGFDENIHVQEELIMELSKRAGLYPE